MSRPYKPPVHGSKAMTAEYRKTMAFMRDTLTRETPLSPDEREEALRKAGAQ